MRAMVQHLARPRAPLRAEGGLRAEIVRIAKEEWEKWERGTKKESSPQVTPYLLDYYRVGVGRTVSAKDLQDPTWQATHPWSAVFISYVMKKAGAGDAFAYSPAHTAYVCAAKRARERATTSAPTKFWAFRVDEARPEVGDLVCKDRLVDLRTKACAGTTWENLCVGGKSHCDVVVEVDRAKSQIRVIGGNVAQSVAQKTVALDANGYLLQPARDRCRWIAVLKPPGESAGPRATFSQGVIIPQVAQSIAAGERDENTLTNLVFYARHPELPANHRIQAHERHLVASWLEIRDRVIRPLLRGLPAAGVT